MRLSDRYDLEFGRDDYATNLVKITTQGLVDIGTTTPDPKLTAKGDIHAEEVKSRSFCSRPGLCIR
ncbi:MAG: hypothetical protein AAF843_15100 [Bacteroidota bacterium]